MVPAFSFLPLAFLILGLNRKNYKALDSLPFVYRDLINVLGLCRSCGGRLVIQNCSLTPLPLQCTTSTACMCVYGLLSFVLTSLELHTLGNQQVSTWFL